MSGEQLQETAAESTPTIDDLLLQLEIAGQSENTSEYAVLLEAIRVLLPDVEDAPRQADLWVELGNILQQSNLSNWQTYLELAIACYNTGLLEYHYEEAPYDWAMIEYNKGIALRKLSELLQGKQCEEMLRDAIVCYDHALTVYTCEVTPDDWAMTQKNKGMALHRLVELVSETERAGILQAVISCYNYALSIYSYETAPDDWAMAQNNKGIALYTLTTLLKDQERAGFLREAIACYNYALTVYTCEAGPDDWAMVQNSKANALRDLAGLLINEKRADTLRSAITCYSYALRVYTQENAPDDWAVIQYNKGILLYDLADFLTGMERVEILHATISSYDAALWWYCRKRMPTDWAAMQNNKGIALYTLSELLAGKERIEALREAIVCYDQAFLEREREEVPLDWAMTHNNKGTALRDLAELLEGKARNTMLYDALVSYDLGLSECHREIAPIYWASIQHNRGNVLRGLAELLEGEERVTAFYKAIECYDAALLERHREEIPFDWAATQNSKGNALHELTKVVAGNEMSRILREALTCYDNALLEYRREVNPTQWALLQNNKGVVCCNLANLLTGEPQKKTLQAAFDCYECALMVYTHDEMQTDWARTQTNKGIALGNLTRLLAGREQMEVLQKALACYDAALNVYTRVESPTDWARTKTIKGNLLRYLAGLLSRTEQVEALRASLACCNEALTIYTREEAPVDWVMAQMNKGNVLYALARLLTSVERVEVLQAAIACYDAALTVRLSSVKSVDWALLQNNKGSALITLTVSLESEEQAETLEAALMCYDAALTFFTREETPGDWALVQNNKGVVLRLLALLQEGESRIEMLQLAIYCYDAALTSYTSEFTPFDWASAQNNKFFALCDCAKLLIGVDRAEKLREALICCDAALTIYTRTILPAEHRRLAQSAGMQLFEENAWTQAAQYLSSALDALDDLFTLEVTAHGRQATLVNSADLTAHLAYALVRAGGDANGLLAAEALERGRARATGEAVARHEAQIATAERLAPELLERFRVASNRLATITLKNSASTTAQEMAHITGDMIETPVIPELVATRAMNEHLTGYEEARSARAAYDEVVALIRQEIPDFLRSGELFGPVVKELKADERLTYVATTPVGAVTLLIEGSDTTPCQPVVRGWWDERLTSTLVAQLLVGPSSTDGKVQQGNIGLLAVSSRRSQLRRVLGLALQILGVRDGVFAELTMRCRAARVRRLVLIPCGLLGLLPLHAAMIPCSTEGETTEPLIDVVQVSYAPSSRIWAMARRRNTNFHARRLEALVVGDPQPQAEETPPLPGARDEAAAISTLISQTGQNHVSTLIGETATHSNVVDMLRKRGSALTHIHFACHGFADLTNPETSGVLLAYSTRLVMHDVLDVAATLLAKLRLVVLSACRTALVGTDLPDEAMGLPSAWLQAGARDVLASLWPVSDTVTFIFMTKFYELHLIDGLEPTEAFWLTQRWLRGLPTWREDFRVLGVERAAMGAEANAIAHVLAPSRGQMECADDAEWTSNEVESQLLEQKSQVEECAVQDGDTTKQPGRWADPYYWAAFAVYGA